MAISKHILGFVCGNNYKAVAAYSACFLLTVTVILLFVLSRLNDHHTAAACYTQYGHGTAAAILTAVSLLQYNDMYAVHKEEG